MFKHTLERGIMRQARLKIYKQNDSRSTSDTSIVKVNPLQHICDVKHEKGSSDKVAPVQLSQRTHII